jgi:hypothetical protein
MINNLADNLGSGVVVLSSCCGYQTYRRLPRNSPRPKLRPAKETNKTAMNEPNDGLTGDGQRYLTKTSSDSLQFPKSPPAIGWPGQRQYHCLVSGNFSLESATISDMSKRGLFLRRRTTTLLHIHTW